MMMKIKNCPKFNSGLFVVSSIFAVDYQIIDLFKYKAFLGLQLNFEAERLSIF
ncbi:hypothetical protein ABID39_001542 [Bartonella japonica]|uniref:Uncharacterized protein n=1 Tax=Bartonella japonica TaxID=357761 RepID=A0ABV2FQL8_9HYPH